MILARMTKTVTTAVASETQDDRGTDMVRPEAIELTTRIATMLATVMSQSRRFSREAGSLALS